MPNVPSTRSHHSLYRVAYTDVSDLTKHWDFWAKNQADAIQSATELLPTYCKILNVSLKEEW
jgi:uncharacterized membrane protein